MGSKSYKNYEKNEDNMRKTRSQKAMKLKNKAISSAERKMLKENIEETEVWNPSDHQVTLYIHLYYYLFQCFRNSVNISELMKRNFSVE